MGLHQRHQMEPLFQAFHSDSEAPRASLVAKMVKNPPVIQETRVRLVGREDPLEKEMTTHSHSFAWRSLWTEEPGRLEPKGLQRVRQDRATHIFAVQGLSDQRERALPVFSMRGVFPEAPSQHSLLSYWPELCHVAYASPNQQAGSRSGRQYRGRKFPQPGLGSAGKEDVEATIALQPDALPATPSFHWKAGNIVTEHDCDLSWGHKEVISLGVL